MRTRENQKGLFSTHVLRTRANEKNVHISVNVSKVKYAKNESVNMSGVKKKAKNKIKYEETLVTDNSVINEPSYFKPLECRKNFLKNLMPHVNERAWKIQRIIIIRNCVVP